LPRALEGTFFVVIGHPAVDELSDLGGRIENVGVEHFGTEGSVEALDIGVLVGLTGLNVIKADTVVLTPSRQKLKKVIIRFLRLFLDRGPTGRHFNHACMSLHDTSAIASGKDSAKLVNLLRQSSM